MGPSGQREGRGRRRGMARAGDWAASWAAAGESRSEASHASEAGPVGAGLHRPNTEMRNDEE